MLTEWFWEQLLMYKVLFQYSTIIGPLKTQCKHENYPSITKRDHGGDDLISQNKNYFEREIWWYRKKQVLIGTNDKWSLLGTMHLGTVQILPSSGMLNVPNCKMRYDSFLPDQKSSISLSQSM